MDRETLAAWKKDKDAALQRGVKLSWSKWLDRRQRSCDHQMQVMYGSMDDFRGGRCMKCAFAEWR